ncbi:inducible alternative oxidase 2 [Nowakowskiella sp. JEL0407]|nr:inducible alternative oxidase 2 [Nowakowskiella sp. JEL0407]
MNVLAKRSAKLATISSFSLAKNVIILSAVGLRHASTLKAMESVEPPNFIPLHLQHPMPIRPEFKRLDMRHRPNPGDTVTGTEKEVKRLSSSDLEALEIGLNVHKTPENFGDWFAKMVVKGLRVPADIFFQGKYLHRAVTLETVAAVPGMVAGTLRHLTSLRQMRHDGGWISLLLHEAENERMHLLIWMKATRPTLLERLVVTAVQGVFYNFYFILYALFPRIAHRTVGYLEEEAVISYTEMINQIDNGIIKNTPAPLLAIEYYGLADNATIRDVALAVRADEEKILSHDEDLRHELPEKPRS